MSMTREEATELLRYRRNLISSVDMDWCANETEALDLVLSALLPVSRERIEEAWRGEWILDEDDGKYQCDNCKIKFPVNYNFCPYCGSAKTEKAMQKVIGKLESLEEMKNG